MTREDKINIGDIMLHDGYPIDKGNQLVNVRIDGFIEDTNLIKCSFFDEHFTNHITTKEELNQNKEDGKKIETRYIKA